MEKKIETTMDDKFLIQYGDFCGFYNELGELAPSCSIEDWQNALWTFGRFLKDHGSAFW